MEEHKRSITTGKQSTGLSEHCTSERHKIDKIKPVKILNKGKKLNFYENLEIRKAIKHNKNIVNNQIELNPGSNLTIVNKLFKPR